MDRNVAKNFCVVVCMGIFYSYQSDRPSRLKGEVWRLLQIVIVVNCYSYYTYCLKFTL